MSVPAQAENWRISSYSNEGQDCVEVNPGRGITGVRDTKHRSGGQLNVSGQAWQALVDQLAH